MQENQPLQQDVNVGLHLIRISVSHYGFLIAYNSPANPSKDVQEVSPSERDRSPMSVTQTSQMVNGDFSRRSKSGRPTPGPGDDTAPSKAVMELKGHTSEVQ